MNKIFKINIILILVFATLFFASCKLDDKDKNLPKEKIKLENTMIDEVEFVNSKNIEISQKSNNYIINGVVDELNVSQKNSLNNNKTTHAISLKFQFDKSRTLKSFEIKGNENKFYSNDDKIKNRTGNLKDFLKSKGGEDDYAIFILSANNKNYQFISNYSDGSTSVINLEINVTLAKSFDK